MKHPKTDLPLNKQGRQNSVFKLSKFTQDYQSNKEGKDQESIQSSTTPDL